MKKDNLDTLFKNLEGQFDVEIPDAGHQARFLEKLNANKQTNKQTNKQKVLHQVSKKRIGNP